METPGEGPRERSRSWPAECSAGPLQGCQCRHFLRVWGLRFLRAGPGRSEGISRFRPILRSAPPLLRGSGEGASFVMLFSNGSTRPRAPVMHREELTELDTDGASPADFSEVARAYVIMRSAERPQVTEVPA